MDPTILAMCRRPTEVSALPWPHGPNHRGPMWSCQDVAIATTTMAARSMEHSISSPVAIGMAIDFNFTPELRLTDGRIIRNIADAIGFAREHESRPGIDQRDEVLHALERAQTREEAHAAAHQFLRWLEELEIVD
jgi:hypothetical protein